MIRKVPHTKVVEEQEDNHIAFLLALAKENSKESFVQIGCDAYSDKRIEFYEIIGALLEYIGFSNVSVTRDGDTNNRMDAIIIDKARSIPIEIKSPREIAYVNIKSLRQALENKIVLLSRTFYPTTKETTSLSIGFSYPNDRSAVDELITMMYDTYTINIGTISLADLLIIFYEKAIEDTAFDLEKIYNLKGRLYD